ncbi:MAG TPA: hypothetical protein VM433_14915 [Mycobacteriales bacterium]|nr:hypothetical protein [Mycobacteriales bacterium]
MTTSPRRGPLPGLRTEAELARMQLDALDRWNRARRTAEDASRPGRPSREMRMDLSRRLEVLRAQHEAIVARADRHLEDSVHLLGRRAPCRAVLVHRNEWFTGKVADALSARGVQVVAALDNGAEAVGVVVAEQPDLLLVEETLPMLPGEEVVREARRYAPTTLIGAQVDYQDRIPALLDAGALTAFTRRVPPADVAQGLLELLGTRAAAPA